MSDSGTREILGLMRSKPGPCVAADGTRGIKATVFDVSKFFRSGIVLQWMGQEATEFYEQNKAELVPGRCLRVEVFHISSQQNEFQASVKTCKLAPPPPSWLKHAEKLNATKPTTPQTQRLRIV